MSTHPTLPYGDTGLLLRELQVDDSLALLLTARVEDPTRWYCAWHEQQPAEPARVDQLLRSQATVEYHKRMAALLGQPYAAFEADGHAMSEAQRAAQASIVAAHGGFDAFFERLFTLSIEQLAALARRGGQIAEHLAARGHGVVPSLT